jgi:hypothetical protein
MEVCSLNYSQYVQQVSISNELTINDFLYHLGSTNSAPVWSPDGRVAFYSIDIENGLEKVAGEWCLVCLAFNLKRLHILMTT